MGIRIHGALELGARPFTLTPIPHKQKEVKADGDRHDNSAGGG